MNYREFAGKASVERPWMKYYPKELLEMIQVPNCTLRQYIEYNIPDLDIAAIHYYGNDITWRTVLANADICARSLRMLGFGEGSQIPVFLRCVPEFIYLLFAAEKIGASLLCRDNSLRENIEAVVKANATVIFAHDFLTTDEKKAYLNSGVRRIVLLTPFNSCERENMPEYVQSNLVTQYTEAPTRGEGVIGWDEFLHLGEGITDVVEAEVDIDRPLYRCYTSGSTGPSKQVIHSAHTMIGVMSQMNFYGGETNHRSTWLVTVLPPALVAVVVSMVLLPMVSRKLLIMDPWVNVYDIDLEFMRYKPNNWPMIPMFTEILMKSKRIPADYDMSHLLAAGAGAEACNNTQLKRFQKFLEQHNCKVPFTTGYGSSEAGSNITFHLSGRPAGNCNVGIPMPLTNVTIVKPGTTEELDYGQSGEICVHGPGVMLGYDDKLATSRVLIEHPDGKVWLHMGDMGYMDKDGHIYTLGRGTSRRFNGGFLDILPMENLLADANIPGIEDQFFVNIPDQNHEGYYEPYLYVILKEGYTVKDVRAQIMATLPKEMVPAKIVPLKERPFWHFKTNRIGLTNEVLAARAVGKAKEEKDASRIVSTVVTNAQREQKETLQMGVLPKVQKTEEKPSIPLEVITISALASLLLGLVVLIGSLVSTGTWNLILLTASVCNILYSMYMLLLVIFTLYKAEKEKNKWFTKFNRLRK